MVLLQQLPRCRVPSKQVLQVREEPVLREEELEQLMMLMLPGKAAQELHKGTATYGR